jgi:predicted transcriptional regulator
LTWIKIYKRGEQEISRVKMKKIELILPDPVVDRLSRIAEERKVTVVDVIQVALTEFVEKEGVS